MPASQQNILYGKTFGARLATLRAAAGLSLKDMKELCRITPSYLSRLESDDRGNPSLATVAVLSAVYGVRRDWFLAGVGEPFLLLADAVKSWSAIVALHPAADLRALRRRKFLMDVALRAARLETCAPALRDTISGEIHLLALQFADDCASAHKPAESKKAARRRGRGASGAL